MDYLSQLLKSQRTRKSLSAINIMGLSVSIAAALLILLYVRFELSYDSFHEGKYVYRVESRLREGAVLTDIWATTTFGHAPAMSREIPGIEIYVRLTAQDKEQVVNYQEKQFIESRYCYTEPSFFELFNFAIVKGEPSDLLRRPNTVVLTESAAHRYFGQTEALGKILTFRTATTEQRFEVTGILADMPANSHIQYDFLLSYASLPKERQDIWYIHGVYTYVRLKPGKPASDIEAAFQRISDNYKTEALKHKTWEVELIPLQQIHLTPQKAYEKEAKGSRNAVYILSVMALALLLIGWVNALNLTVARFLERGKEFGVRKAFGASRKQLFVQGLLEAGIIHLLAALVALGWIEVFLPVVCSWTGQSLGSQVLLQPGFWGVLFAIVGVGTLFTGLYPSFLLAQIRPSAIIRGRLLHSQKGNKMRKALIVAQFAASFVLITGTFVVVKQVQYMQNETASASMRQILVIQYPSFTEEMTSRMESFRKQLKQITYVREVTVSGAVPGVEVANYFTNRPYGSDLSEVKLIQMFAVDYDYLNTYALDMIAGRGFSEAYGDELNKVVLNEEAARLLGFTPDERALGKQLKMEVVNEPLQVIGIVRNYHQQSLAVPYKPIIFFLKERVPFIATPYISIRIDGEMGADRLAEVEQIYKNFFPSSLFSYFYLDDFNHNQYKEDRNFGWIFASAALLAVFVACLGLWVVTLFSTLARMREVGVRKVLGATKTNLFVVLTRELLLLTVLASTIGIPVSVFLMHRWLEGYAFHIGLPGWIYVVAFALLVVIAFLTITRQIARIIGLKPMHILKSE